MLRRVVVAGAAIVLISWFQLGLGGNPSYWFFVFAVLFLFLFYFVTDEDWISLWVVLAFLFLSIGYGAIQKGGVSYTFLPLTGVAASLGALGLSVAHLNSWNKRISDADESRRLMKQETGLLESRYLERMESLAHLERQVSGLINLFDMARNFNECLEFAGVISVLDRKIASELSFSRGTLALIEPLDQASKRVGRALSFGPMKWEEAEAMDRFAEGCLRILVSLTQPVKLQKPEQIQETALLNCGAQFPLWLFPLSVEHQLIALLIVEGGSENDFPKFEILASQMALQVKKIRLYETVKEISIVDGLTHVFVRRHFLERFREELERAVRYKFPLSVLMVDVDHFKRYNDQFGHLAGDRALREVAQLIRENVRRVDVLGRFGGEEFVIVAPEIEKEKGLELAERIRSAVAHKHLNIYGEEAQVTVSIGICAFPDDGLLEGDIESSEAGVSELIRKADEALYRAKEEGRNRIVSYG